MRSVKPNGATQKLKPPKDWDHTKIPCDDLWIKAWVIEGIPYLASAWLPTPEELKKLNEGGPVLITILNPTMPPVAVEVGTVVDISPAIGLPGGGPLPMPDNDSGTKH